MRPPRNPGGAGWVAAGLPTVVAAMTFARVIDINPAMLRVAPAVAVVVLAYALAFAAVGGPRRRWWAAAVPVTVGMATTAVWALVFGAATVPRDVAPLLAFGRGLASGLSVILTSSLPTLTVPQTVVPAIMLTGTATVLACLLVTLSMPATTLVASGSLFAVGLALGAGSSIGAVALAVTYVVAAALALLLLGPWVKDQEAEQGPSMARTVSAFIGLLLVGALALVVGVAVPQLWTRAAFDPRTTPPEQVPRVSIDIDPLDVATRWQLVDTTDDRTLVKLAPERPVEALGWVALETYDGVSWRPGRPTLDLGRTVPPDRNASASPAVEGRARVTVTDALPGTWLPAPYRPFDVIGGRVLADAESATLQTVGTAAGRTYQVRYRQTTPTRARLATAGPAPIPREDPVRAYPQPFPANLASFAAVAQRGRTGTFARMSALAAALSAPRFRAQTEYSANLRNYVGLEEVLRSRKGTQEQYAAMFVLMARASGVPARLVVGYRVPDGATGDIAITPRDVRVWGEAAIDGVGWVPFAASPQDRADGGLGVEVTDDEPSPSASASAGASARPSPSSTADTASASGGGVLRVVGGVALLLVLPITVLLRAWWVRRLRRRLRDGWRRGSSRERVVGAWAFARASLADASLPLPPGRSPDDVAVDTGDLPDDVGRPLRALAAIAAPALFAPDDVTAADADAAWSHADTVAGAARATLTRRGRLRRALRRPTVPGTGRLLARGPAPDGAGGAVARTGG